MGWGGGRERQHAIAWRAITPFKTPSITLLLAALGPPDWPSPRRCPASRPSQPRRLRRRIRHQDLPCTSSALRSRGNFNRNKFFDIVWFASLNLETVVLVPQLWMMSNIGGKLSSISSQFVACNVFSKVLTVTFWIWAYSELVDKDGSNTVGQMIIGAYLTQLFLSADFMFYYVKGWLEGTDAVVLPSQAEGIEL